SDWFSQVYRNYLEYLSKTGNIENIHSIVNEEKDLHLLLNTIYRAGAVENDTIVEYIVLKGLYDGYFSSEFKESAILEMLDTLRNTTGIKEHRLTAENILTKVTRLKTGNKPPGFTLPAFDSTLVSLDDLKGKFVYLNFCTSLSFPCLSQFNLIKPIYEKYREVLHVVTVSVDEDNSRFMNLIRTNGYTWIFLDARDQPDIINLYDIHAFPTYFLIGPDGRLVLSPAPEPGADFERYFSDVLRSRNVLNPHP
ncbi:MAG: redoxin domain-containing protein, partial [Bacteroidales bacterium]